MDAQTKEQLVAELRDYLDTLPETSEDSAPGDTPANSREVDLYTLFTELAGVRNEVRLESRQLKRALDEFHNVCSNLEDDGKRLGNALEAQQTNQAAAVANAERTLLLELIDLHDRLAQARDLAASQRPGALARLLWRRHTMLVQGMAEGLDITLRRLDQSLQRHGVVPIQGVGEPLDPHCMRVTTVQSDPWQTDGTVLEEVRRGYRRGAEVLRLAEVVANKIEDTEQAI